MPLDRDATLPVSHLKAALPMRIAMWSGPRNISTAMMRAWGNRTDTVVCDEPLYAHYLRHTGLPHPGADKIIASQENDWRKVVRQLTADPPDGKSIFYQKHMAHHFLPCIERSWLWRLHHCFLIREPREMITSLMKILPEPRLEDTGLPQQMEIFDWVWKATGTIPPVLEAKDVLDNPRKMLVLLCKALKIEFMEEMLQWPPGPRDTDGVWAKHWYASVHETTTFGPYHPKPDEVPDRLKGLLARCESYYDSLYEHRLGQ